MKAWEVDLIIAQADESTWQSAYMTKADTDTYQGQILERLSLGKATLVSYEDLKTVYLVNFLNDFVGEFHVFSDGGTWALTESFRRFQRDVWGHCLQMRIETRVRKPVLQAILKRCGVPVEGVRHGAWYDSKACQMVDENMYALHRPKTSLLAAPSAEMVVAFENKISALAVAMARDCDLVTPAVKHIFQDKIYLRETTIRKGTCAIGYKHKKPHVVIISGDVVVKDATGSTRYMGLTTFKSPAGVQRTAYAMQDTVFTTVQLLDNPEERDLRKIEAEFFEGGYTELNQRYLTNQTMGLLS